MNYDSEKSNLNEININSNYKERNFEIVDKENIKIIYFNKLNESSQNKNIDFNLDNYSKIFGDNCNNFNNYNNNYINRKACILNFENFENNNNNYINNNDKNLINSNLNQHYINNNYNNSLNGLIFSDLNRNFDSIRNQIFTNLNPLNIVNNNNYFSNQNILMNNNFNNHLNESPDFIKYNDFIMQNIQRNLILNNLNKSLLMDLLKKGN